MCRRSPLTTLPEKLAAGTTVTIEQTTDNPAVFTPQRRRRADRQPSRESADGEHWNPIRRHLRDNASDVHVEISIDAVAA
jgi:hypothetical protein